MRPRYTTIFAVLAISSVHTAVRADEVPSCPQNIVPLQSRTPENEQRELLLKLAGACMHAGKPTQAIALFSQLISIDPADALSYMNRGTVRVALGDIELGINDYNSAISLQPGLMEAWYNRGNAVLLHLHRFESAISDFTEAIRLNPDFAPAYCGRGLAKVQLGHCDDAFADYAFGIDRDPKQTYCHFNRGNLYLSVGDYQKAISDFTIALSEKSSDAITLSRRGQAYESLGQPDLALADYRAALNISPSLESAKKGMERLSAQQKH